MNTKCELLQGYSVEGQGLIHTVYKRVEEDQEEVFGEVLPDSPFG